MWILNEREKVVSAQPKTLLILLVWIMCEWWPNVLLVFLNCYYWFGLFLQLPWGWWSICIIWRLIYRRYQIRYNVSWTLSRKLLRKPPWVIGTIWCNGCFGCTLWRDWCICLMWSDFSPCRLEFLHKHRQVLGRYCPFAVREGADGMIVLISVFPRFDRCI